MTDRLPEDRAEELADTENLLAGDWIYEMRQMLRECAAELRELREMNRLEASNAKRACERYRLAEAERDRYRAVLESLVIGYGELSDEDCRNIARAALSGEVKG